MWPIWDIAQRIRRASSGNYGRNFIIVKGSIHTTHIALNIIPTYFLVDFKLSYSNKGTIRIRINTIITIFRMGFVCFNILFIN